MYFVPVSQLYTVINEIPKTKGIQKEGHLQFFMSKPVCLLVKLIEKYLSKVGSVLLVLESQTIPEVM